MHRLVARRGVFVERRSAQNGPLAGEPLLALGRDLLLPARVEGVEPRPAPQVAADADEQQRSGDREERHADRSKTAPRVGGEAADRQGHRRGAGRAGDERGAVGDRRHGHGREHRQQRDRTQEDQQRRAQYVPGERAAPGEAATRHPPQQHVETGRDTCRGDERRSPGGKLVVQPQRERRVVAAQDRAHLDRAGVLHGHGGEADREVHAHEQHGQHRERPEHQLRRETVRSVARLVVRGRSVRRGVGHVAADYRRSLARAGSGLSASGCRAAAAPSRGRAASDTRGFS